LINDRNIIVLKLNLFFRKTHVALKEGKRNNPLGAGYDVSNKRKIFAHYRNG